MIRIPRGTSASVNAGKVPAWYRWREHVMLACPNGHKAVLRFASGDGHAIDDHGVVTPSVGCFNGDCSFHEHIVLEDWQSNPTPNPT